jgi:hypothetical protein
MWRTVLIVLRFSHNQGRIYICGGPGTIKMWRPLLAGPDLKGYATSIYPYYKQVTDHVIGCRRWLLGRFSP